MLRPAPLAAGPRPLPPVGVGLGIVRIDAGFDPLLLGDPEAGTGIPGPAETRFDDGLGGTGEPALAVSRVDFVGVGEAGTLSETSVFLLAGFFGALPSIVAFFFLTGAPSPAVTDFFFFLTDFGLAGSAASPFRFVDDFGFFFFGAAAPPADSEGLGIVMNAIHCQIMIPTVIRCKSAGKLKQGQKRHKRHKQLRAEIRLHKPLKATIATNQSDQGL